MMKSRLAMIAIAASLAFTASLPAYAGNTNFLTERNASVTFPLSPPNRASSLPGRIDNMTIGATTPAPATITNLVVTGTVSGASLNSLTSPGPIGSVAPGSGAFTTLSASGTVSGAGVTARFSAPGPIGDVTPSTASVTTLAASGAVSGAGVTARFATPGPIGSTAASTGAFTTLTASGQITSTTGTPTITSGACGTTTNGAIVSGSTNQAGSITIGSAATTACTISWSATLASAPKACVFMAMNAAAIAATTLPYVGIPSTTAVVLNGAVLASTNWNYICL